MATCERVNSNASAATGTGTIAAIELSGPSKQQSMFSSPKRFLPNLLAAFCLCILCTVAHPSRAADQKNDDLQIEVTRSKDVIKVQARVSVPVSAQEAFAVLTDYDHMRDFLPDVVESRVMQRSTDKLLVSQSMRVKLGFLSMPVESVRSVALEPPYKLVSRAVSGTISKAEVVTTLAEDHGKTLVTYESVAEVSTWLPDAIGTKIVATRVREQLTSMRAEMLRRRSARSATQPVNGALRTAPGEDGPSRSRD